MSYRDLTVWKLAIDLVELAYRSTHEFPKSEVFGLQSQIRRSAVSIAANIAEGNSRSHMGDYLRFLSIAQGSHAELETLILVAKRLGYLGEEPELEDKLDHVGRSLTALRKSLESSN